VLDSPEVRTQLLSAGSPRQLVGFLIDIMGPAESVENRTAETAHPPADEWLDDMGCCILSNSAHVFKVDSASCA
jgi:hypothetical protein